jgi:hypothetical protein
MTTTTCGISHKDTKHIDKCNNNNNNNRTKQHRKNDQTTNTSSKYWGDNTKTLTKYTHITQGPYNKQ